MKKWMNLLLSVSVLGVFTVSCLNDRDENAIEDIEIVKIDSVEVPETTMSAGDYQTIKTYSTLYNNCENFYGYDYQYSVLNRYITAYKFKTNTEDCGEEKARSISFNFAPTEAGTYTMYFYAGKNASDEDTWITKTIVVE